MKSVRSHNLSGPNAEKYDSEKLQIRTALRNVYIVFPIVIVFFHGHINLFKSFLGVLDHSKFFDHKQMVSLNLSLIIGILANTPKNCLKLVTYHFTIRISRISNLHYVECVQKRSFFWSVCSPNAGKTDQKKRCIWALFAQCRLSNF